MTTIGEAAAALIELGIAPALIGAVIDNYSQPARAPRARGAGASMSAGALRTRRWRARKATAAQQASHGDGERHAVTVAVTLARGGAGVLSPAESGAYTANGAPLHDGERHGVTSPTVTRRHRDVTGDGVRQKEFPPTPPYKKNKKIPKRASPDLSQGHLPLVFQGGRAAAPRLERLPVRRCEQPALFDRLLALGRFNATFRSYLRERGDWNFEVALIRRAAQDISAHENSSTPSRSSPIESAATGPPATKAG